ncbi:hypothetical protein [Bradyrhizobium sp. UFLA05-112]
MTIISCLERLLLEGALDLSEEFDGEITVLTVEPADGSDSLPKAVSLSEPAVLFADPGFADAGSLSISYTQVAAIYKNLQAIYCRHRVQLLPALTAAFDPQVSPHWLSRNVCWSSSRIDPTSV